MARMAKTTLRAATAEASQVEADLRAELAELRQRFALVSAHDAEVTAACRAGLAGFRDGELDPWTYQRGVLEEYGQLPRDDQHPSELLALGYRCGGAP